MDYIYSELDPNLITEPYGRCYYFNDLTITTTVPEGSNTISLEESFSEDGQTVIYGTYATRYEYFVYPKPYGKLTRIVRDGIEDLSNWVGPTETTKNNTVYYLYRTSSMLSDPEAEVTFMV